MLAAKITSSNPVVAYTQLFHNGQKDRNDTATIKKVHKRENTYTFSVSRGISTTLNSFFTAGFRKFAEFHTEIHMAFSSGWGTTKTKTEEVTYQIDQEVIVPPETTVRVQWIVTEDELVNI
ncbi:unnamed protein product, partial [Ixodes hexagonus]